MPIYEYQCQDCQETQTVQQTFQEEALQDCPLCGGKLVKLFSAPVIIYRGSGWAGKKVTKRSDHDLT